MNDNVASMLLDQHLRLKLAELESRAFEQFFLHFLNAGVSLEIERNGERVERRVIEVGTYAAGSGRDDKGVDLIAKMAGGETWAFQCKRWKEWGVSNSKKAIQDAVYPANHYFLLVACDPREDVQDYMATQPAWSFWNLDRICAEFRLRVPKGKQAQALYFLSPEELKRFAPYSTDALVPAADYFAALQRAGNSFHHRYRLAGRTTELARMVAFAKAPGAKILLLSGRGGEGKSRLLREFADRLGAEPGAPEVVFLNPHSTGDVTLAMWERDAPRVVVVDDAHRVERVSHELLARLQEAKATKLVLATRPQGNEALDARLREHGFEPPQPLEIRPLSKKDMRRLAEEALGPELKTQAKDLIELTGDSPFLTTLAGDLLQRGELKWGAWHSDVGFRAAVFQAFERDNLAGLSESDHEESKRLLRILALLAPVTPDAVFHERASACLGLPVVRIEALLQRLQVAGVVSAESRNMRVIPDLFADFLVFDTAFDRQRRLPELARVVLQKFAEESAALLRNLAEATWIARDQATGRDELLRPLLDAEFARFDAASFFVRSRMIERWATFSVYLPAEALELAKQALEETTAPTDATMELLRDSDDDGVNSHRYLRSWLPTLLKPVALWHDEHRTAALDFLWLLGCDTPKGQFNGGENHPWGIIAEVLTFTPRKPITVVAAGLEWVARLVQRPSVLKNLEENRAILRTLTEPCFARSAKCSEWRGRTVRLWEEAVDLKCTKPLREQALAILQWVIEHGSWLAALDAVRAVEHAFHRIGPVEAARAIQQEKLRESWRPERLQALGLLPHVLTRHTQPVMRFAVRQLLHRDLAYEEDTVFGDEVRKVLATITDDLDLRLANVLNTQGHFEFAEEFGQPVDDESEDNIKKLWAERVQVIATEFLRVFPEPGAAMAHLDRIASESAAGGFTPRFGELFPAIARQDPACAVRLAKSLFDPEASVRMAGSWHQFLFGFGAEQNTALWELLESALRHPRSAVRFGVIDYFRFRDHQGLVLNERERAMLERMAASAGPDDVRAFLALVQWVTESSALWGFRLLDKLPLTELAPQLPTDLLSALNPYKAKDAVPPLDTVQHVLAALVSVPEIDAGRRGGGFTRIAGCYPLAVYEFVLRRIEHAEQLGDRERYRPLPHETLGRFRLPGLERDPAYPEICAFLWAKVMGDSSQRMESVWRELYHGVVLDNVDFWRPRLIAAIESAASSAALNDLVELIRFDGSLIAFRFPEVAAAFLRRAEDLAGTEGLQQLRSSLHGATGPRSRGYTNGVLDGKQDYVEAEAIKAAANHAADPVLGPFYRWLVDVERHEREAHRHRYQATMAAMDEE